MLAVLTTLILFGCGGGGGGGSTGTTDAGNQTPNAFAGNDRTVAVGSTVALDGSNSSDSDGDRLTFDWCFVSMPQGSNAALSDTAAARPDFSADEAGEYIVELAVSDGAAMSKDSVIITASSGQSGTDCSLIVPGDNAADDFVCAHNDVRDHAQPAPSPPLPLMNWDLELERIAREYANTCTWAHNPHRSDTYPGYVGENLYITTWQNSTPENAVQSWADEARHYDYASNTCQSGEVCGHYTQIVWRNSVNIGCARVFCPTVSGLNYTNAYLYVCNYAPGGNYIGQRPY